MVGALALSTGLDPLPLVVGTGLAASGGFLLPVATPPNAIVYGSGRITIPQCGPDPSSTCCFLLLVSFAAAVLVPLAFGR